MSDKIKVRKVKNKKGNPIAVKVKKDDLEEDFEKFWKSTCKYLNADSLKIEDYDEELVIAYDRNKNYHV